MFSGKYEGREKRENRGGVRGVRGSHEIISRIEKHTTKYKKDCWAVKISGLELIKSEKSAQRASSIMYLNMYRN